MSVIASPRTAVHLVTLLEEMPVQETIDGVAELEAASLPVGGVLVNMARPPRLTDIEMDQALTSGLPIKEIERGLHDAGVTSDIERAAHVLAGEGRDHALRVHLEQQEITRLDALDVPVLQLPYVPGGIDLSSLYELASVLSDQGASP